MGMYYGDIQGVVGETEARGLTGTTGTSGGGYSEWYKKEQEPKHSATLTDMYPKKTINFITNLLIWLRFKDREFCE
jgi:hypothetical protein